MDSLFAGITEEFNFTHLHVHTEYSFLDGLNKCKSAAKRARELNMKAMAITDHNHVGGVIEFQNACKKEGIKPILGCEMYWTRDTNILSMSKEDRDEWAMKQARDAGFDIDGEIYKLEHPISEKTGKEKKARKITKAELNVLLEPYEYDTKQYHIILLAINQTGWSNLVRLQSEAAEKCTFKSRFCCDNDMLAKYSEGLIMTTACIGNAVPSLINSGKHDEARELLQSWKDIFGDRLYVEIQPLNIDKQHMANYVMLNWAADMGIQFIATTDVHYTLESDHADHDIFVRMNTGKTIDDTDTMIYSNDYWIKSYDEMIEHFDRQADAMAELFEDLFDKETYMDTVRDALYNTNVIADRIEEIHLGSDVDLFPRLEIPMGLTAESYLEMKCFQNLYKYKKSHPEINLRLYERRLHDELYVINTKGFAPYILVVQDYIEWANAHGCPTGPGRGSGAGSLVLFMMGITKIIDPIKYGLLFFRFLTMDRTAPPDIDTDFEYNNRDRVIEYLEQKYGKQCVAHIGTLSEFGVRSGLKDVGRVLNMDFGLINTITSRVVEWSDKPDLAFEDLDKLKDSDREIEKQAWNEFNSYEQQYPELFRLARRFEGIKKNMGVHASGILITPMPVTDLFPTRKSEKDGKDFIATLYTGTQLEELKAIKFDILGLKTLTVIQQTLTAIDANLTWDDLYQAVDIDDPEMFKMIQAKQTDGLFQIESNLFKGMIENIVPNSMNDIIVLNSLGRPGPLSAGMDKSYAARKHGEEESCEPLPRTWEVVSDTYGTICYQEQIMLIAKIVAGFDDNQADSYLRKAFAKKKKDKMTLCRQWFIYGKINQEAPEGYDDNNKNQSAYDPAGKCGPSIPGGIALGYEEAQLIAFWSNIEGFADYLFNKSHAACYSFLTVLTGWLKTYYPVEFLAALMSVQSEKVNNYANVARSMNIPVRCPDINLSGEDFLAVNGAILYGLRSVSGVGGTAIPAIMENRPYTSLEDAITKKVLNKKTGMSLIKSGAFDSFDTNRYQLVNDFYELRHNRADEEDELPDPTSWGEEACIEYEKEVLNTTLTYIPFWDNIQSGEKATVTLTYKNIQEKFDKNGNMMAFIDGTSHGCTIRCVAFSSTYCKNSDKFDRKRYAGVVVEGKKDDKGSLVISKVIEGIRAVQEPELDRQLADVL